MGALLIALSQITSQSEGIIVKHYGKKYGSGGSFFNAVICFFAMIFFFITDKNGLTFPKELIPYGIFSCILYATGFYTAYVAYRTGPFMLSRLFLSFAGIIPIIYGIAFLKEPTKITTYIGIFLVFFSVYLIWQKNNSTSAKDAKTTKGFSPVWVIAILLMVASNGLIGVLSRTQQIKFNHAYDNEFMIMSFGGAFLSLLIFEIINDGFSFLKSLKSSVGYGMLAGFCNGGTNLFNLLLYLYIPISVATPIRTGLGFIFNFLISVLLYKEKFSKQQVVAVLLGIVAMIMFKL